MEAVPSKAFNGLNSFQLRLPKPHSTSVRRTSSISAASECSYVQQTCMFQDVAYEPDAHADLSASGNSPWENAVQQLQTAFTGPIAKGLSLVAVGGLMFAFGEGGNKRMFAGIVFGIGMAIAAVNFLSWLFPGS